MNIKSTLLVVVSLCVCDLAYSQNNAISNAINKKDISINNTDIKNSNSPAKDIIPFWKGWSVGFGYGLTQFDGDVRQYDHFPAKIEADGAGIDHFFELKSAASLSLSKKINSYYSVSAELLSGKFAGLSRSEKYEGYTVPQAINYEGNGDKFVASFTEADLIFNLDVSNIMSYFTKTRKANKFSFEGKLGIGYNKYNSLRTNLFSDTHISSWGYEGTQKKGIFSSPSETVYIYGILAKYKLNNRLNLVLDCTVRNGKTDKWDASIMSTPSSDKFTFLSVGITYKFGKHDYNNEWKSPIDGLFHSLL